MRLIILAAYLALFISCGDNLFGPDITGATIDATTDADLGCPSPPFPDYDPPVLVAEISSPAKEKSPTLANGGLSIYFTRTETVSGFTVNVPYVAHRVTLGGTFELARRAADFGTSSIFDLETSDDESEWVYWKGLGELASSTSTQGEVSPPQSLGFTGFSPSLSSDRLKLYYLSLSSLVFSRTRPDRGSDWESPKTEMVPFAKPTSIDISINSLFMIVTTESGVWATSREDINDSFGSPVLLFVGRYEDARLGGGDQFITMIDASGNNRQIYIATAR